MTDLARIVVAFAILGCGGTPAPAPIAVPVPADAAVPPPDADVPREVADAPAWVFRYNVPPRIETWTLRHHGDRALMIVETHARPAVRYTGSAITENGALVLKLVAATASLALTCKAETLAVGPPCETADAPAAPAQVLSCYHPDFAAPMPFAEAPGVEYTAGAACHGYRRLR